MWIAMSGASPGSQKRSYRATADSSALKPLVRICRPRTMLSAIFAITAFCCLGAVWMHRMIIDRHSGHQGKVLRHSRRMGSGDAGLDSGAKSGGAINGGAGSRDSGQVWNLEDYARRMEERGLGIHGEYSRDTYYTQAYDEADHPYVGAILQPRPPPPPPESGKSVSACSSRSGCKAARLYRRYLNHHAQCYDAGHSSQNQGGFPLLKRTEMYADHGHLRHADFRCEGICRPGAISDQV